MQQYLSHISQSTFLGPKIPDVSFVSRCFTWFQFALVCRTADGTASMCRHMQTIHIGIARDGYEIKRRVRVANFSECLQSFNLEMQIEHLLLTSQF